MDSPANIEFRVPYLQRYLFDAIPNTSPNANPANLPNRYGALCWRPVTHAQTWASYSALTDSEDFPVNPTNPNRNSNSNGNPNPSNPTNPNTKYHWPLTSYLENLFNAAEYLWQV